MGLFQDLRQQHADLWERMVTHPFVTEMGADTLPLATFQRYFLQDYIFLRDLVRLVGIAIARAPDLESARRLTAFLHDILEGEASLFQGTFHSWGMAPDDYLGAEPLPVTRAFGDFLVRVAFEGSFADAIAMLGITEGTYLDWATRLTRSGAVPKTTVYRAWVDIHSNNEFAAFVQWLHDALEAIPLSPEQQDRLAQLIGTCLSYEHAFWEAAYRA